MKITILAVGSIKEKYLKDGINEYLKRISKYAKIEVIEIPDKSINDDINKVKKEEGEAIIKKIPNDSYVITCDLAGKMLDSLEFAKKIDEIYSFSSSNICFIIGGSLGLDNNVLLKANYSLCFSKFTFTHQFARLIILEQIYRAFKINNNETYHK